VTKSLVQRWVPSSIVASLREVSPLRLQESLVRVMTRTNAQRTGIGGHPWAAQRPVPDSPTAANWKVVTFVAARPKRQERS
jgi:hypothetical protein